MLVHNLHQYEVRNRVSYSEELIGRYEVSCDGAEIHRPQIGRYVQNSMLIPTYVESCF